jgi:cathepsin F
MLAVLLLVVALCAVLAKASATQVTLGDFQQFQRKFRVKYGTAEEEAQRFEYFQKNVAEAYARNATEPYAVFGITQFSDRSPKELDNLLNRKGPASIYDISSAKQLPLLPAEDLKSILKDGYDWRDLGVITEIKNQGGCGSCWTFGTVASIEATNALQGRGLINLSEQELLNCCGRDGADTGPYCIDWIRRNGGLNSLDNYPYTAGDAGITCTGGNSVCNGALASQAVGTVSGVQCLPNDPSGANENTINLYMQMSGK